MIDDLYIINKFLSKTNQIIKARVNKISKEESEYLKTRYNDCFRSYDETIFRIFLHIDNIPLCPICNQYCIFTHRLKQPYSKTCLNKSCSTSYIKQHIYDCCEQKYGNKYYNNRTKYKQTCLERYGYDNPNKTDIVRNKITNTCLEKYGVESVTQLSSVKEKSKQTCLERYGVEYGWNNDTQKQTCLERYGVENVNKLKTIRDKIKQICLERYGVENVFKLEKNKLSAHSIESFKKRYNTHKLNKSFNVSKPEDECYELLKEKYPDIIRQYRNERYPFNCDFYIPSLDLFIEYQGTWTHGGKPFEGTEEDLLKLQEWCEKNTKYYDNAIYTWTELDVRKRNIAK